MDKVKSDECFRRYILEEYKIEKDDMESIWQYDFAEEILLKCIKYNKIDYFKRFFKVEEFKREVSCVCGLLLDNVTDVYSKYCYIYKESNMFKELSYLFSLEVDYYDYCEFALNVYKYFNNKRSSYQKEIEKIILKTILLVDDLYSTREEHHILYDSILLKIYKKNNESFEYIEPFGKCKVGKINKNSIVKLKKINSTVGIIQIIYSLLINKTELIEICKIHENIEDNMHNHENVSKIIFNCILIYYTRIEYNLDKLNEYFNYLSNYLQRANHNYNITYLITLLKESNKLIEDDKYISIVLSIINNDIFYILSGHHYNKATRIFYTNSKNKLQEEFSNKIIELNIHNTVEFTNGYYYNWQSSNNNLFKFNIVKNND